MIFIGQDFDKSRHKFGIKFSKSPTKIHGINFNHYYLIIHFGSKRFWIGYNRLKRKIRDKLYTINGKDIHY